jgi:hypothetical protein
MTFILKDGQPDSNKPHQPKPGQYGPLPVYL